MVAPLMIVVWVAVLVAVGYAAHYIITRFFPPDLHLPALLIVGVLLLMVLVLYVIGWPPGAAWRGH